MKIQVLYFSGCPNHGPTLDLSRQVVEQLQLDAQVEEVEVTGDDDARRLRFLGSPTVQINGVDIDPQARERTDYGLACRIYNGSGVPPREMILGALQAARVEDSEAAARACCAVPAPSPSGVARRERQRAGIWATLAAVGSATVSSACCWLPLVLVSFGVSAAGVSSVFERFRWPFAVGAAALLGLGVYVLYFRQPGPANDCCAQPGRGGRRLNRSVFWVAALMVLGLVLFPNYAQYVFAAADPEATSAKEEPIGEFVIPIEGMTCEGCAARIAGRLASAPHVARAVVSYEQREAHVRVRRVDDEVRRELVAAIEALGHVVDRQGIHVRKRTN